MIIEYYLIDPTGNITILVRSEVPVEKQPAIAELLMKKEPCAEQVGFVGNNSLRMAGGEFCGNAAISTAALIQFEKGAETGSEEKLLLDVSGAENKVGISAERISENEFICRAEMPKPVSVEKYTLSYNSKDYDFIAVDFGSIIHFVCKGGMEKVSAEKAIKIWSDQLGRDCVGVMFLNKESMELSPLVYVRNPPSLFWESSCASGSSAAGMALAAEQGRQIEASFKEPGGILSVSASLDGEIILKGKAKIIKKSMLEI